MLLDFVEPLLTLVLVSSHNLEGGNCSKKHDCFIMYIARGSANCNMHVDPMYSQWTLGRLGSSSESTRYSAAELCSELQKDKY